jgi:ABC-type multidrug transport system fused ATPase/permease subunit
MISVERILEMSENENEYAPARSPGVDHGTETETAASRSSWCSLTCCGPARRSAVRSRGRGLLYSALPDQDAAEGPDITAALLPAKSDGDVEAGLNPMRRPDPTICIDFHLVSMRYPSASCDVLRGLSLSVRCGSRVAVVGRTGSGKSSLLRLLLRLDDFREGSARLCGCDLRTLSKPLLRGEVKPTL